MAKNYSFSIFLKDFMSSKLMKMAQTAGSTYNKINQLQGNHQKGLFQSAKNLDGLRSKFDALSKQQGTATTIKELRKVNGAIQKTKHQIQKLENLPPNTFIDRLRNVKGLFNGWAGAAVGAVGVMSVWNGFKGISKLGLDLEQTRIKFETLLGGTAKATKMMENLNSFANKTPFENAHLQKNAELLLNFGLKGNKILPTLKMLGDVSGGNANKLNSLSLAYAQVQSTGKLMGQDLLQLINAGFNPLQLISEKTGASMGKLKDDMSKGKISAKMVEQAFVTATSKGGRFYGMMDKISQSGWGKLSTFFGNLKTKLAAFSITHIVPKINKVIDVGIKLLSGFDKIKNSVLKLFNAFAPLWNSLTNFIGGLLGITKTGNAANKIINTFSSLINFISIPIEVLSLGISKVVNWLKPLLPLLALWAAYKSLLIIKQTALNIAMTANPIGLVITGIVALIGSIVYAYQKISWFRGGIMAIWETLKGFGSALKTLVVDRIKDILNGIVGIGKTLLMLFQGKWKQAWEVGKQATKDLIGIDSTYKAISKVQNIGKNAAKAYQKGVNEVVGKKGLSLVSKLTPKTPILTSATTGPGTGGLADSDTFKDGITEISQGGNRQTNISVQFDKLIEQLVIKTETISEGVDEMEDRIKEALMRVLNSTNHMQTQSR